MLMMNDDAWCKFRELYPLLSMREFPLKFKINLQSMCTELLYGSETWAMKVEDMNKLERAERSMLRMMCDVSFKDRKSSKEIR